MIARLNVNREQVHIGMMFYSDTFRTYMSVKLGDQRTSRAFVNKVRDIPYVPFKYSSISPAVKKARTEMFATSRSYLVPRVAVIFNDARTNPKQELANETLALKNLNVEVFSVGLGKNVDENELKMLASRSGNVFKLVEHNELFLKLDKLLQQVCTVNAPIEFNKKEYLKMEKNDIRYFVADISPVKYGIAEIEIEDLYGSVKLYFSFTNSNPQLTDEYRYNVTKNSEDNKTYYFLFLPDNAKQVYLTVVSLDKKTEINLIVREFE